MIPPPQNSHPDMTTSQKIEEHKAHIRSILQKHKYVSADRTWIKRYHGWAGHISRLPPERWARQMLEFKNVAWWRKQQQTETGHRHTKTRGSISRWENALVRYHQNHSEWGKTARDRFDWPCSFAPFEKAVFGPNSPHVFPDDPKSPKQDTNTQMKQGGARQKRRREGDTQQLGEKHQKTTTRGNQGEENRRGSRRGYHPHPTTLEESMNLPLASLLIPQDVRTLTKPQFVAVSGESKATASRENGEKQEPGKGDGKGDGKGGGATLSRKLSRGVDTEEEDKKNCFEAIDDEEGKDTTASRRQIFRAEAHRRRGEATQARRQATGRRGETRPRPSRSRFARRKSTSTSTTSTSSSSTSTSTSTSSRPRSFPTSRTRPTTTTTTTTTTTGGRSKGEGGEQQRGHQQQEGAKAEAGTQHLPHPSRSAQAGAAEAAGAAAAQLIPSAASSAASAALSDPSSAAASEQQRHPKLVPGAAAAAPAQSPPNLPRLDEGRSSHDERNGRDERTNEGQSDGAACQTHRQPADGVRHDARKRRHDEGQRHSDAHAAMEPSLSSSSAAAPPPAHHHSDRHSTARNEPNDEGAADAPRELRRRAALASRPLLRQASLPH